MTVYYYQFEWDPNKNATNIEKHGIAFEEASTVFDDVFCARYQRPRPFRQRRSIHHLRGQRQSKRPYCLPLLKTIGAINPNHIRTKSNKEGRIDVLEA